jgi:hypothetical protein
MRIGEQVGWRWSNGLATGVVRDIRPERTELISKGSRIIRNGTAADPALIIEHSSGSRVLKLLHEVQSLTG